MHIDDSADTLFRIMYHRAEECDCPVCRLERHTIEEAVESIEDEKLLTSETEAPK